MSRFPIGSSWLTSENLTACQHVLHCKLFVNFKLPDLNTIKVCFNCKLFDISTLSGRVLARENTGFSLVNRVGRKTDTVDLP